MKFLFAICIAITPFNILRIFLYRILLGYNISYKGFVKPFNFINCKDLTIMDNAGFLGYFNFVSNVNKMVIGKNSHIGKLNRFRDFNSFQIRNNAKIGSSNIFFGTPNNISPFKQYENITIGSKSIIASKHTFDLSDEVRIGCDVTFGGSGSQIWTHGFDLEHTKKQSSIAIEDCCYFGSSVIILPGSAICKNVSIGAGTVISKPILESGFYVSSNLLKKGEITNFKLDESVIEKNGYYFLRK